MKANSIGEFAAFDQTVQIKERAPPTGGDVGRHAARVSDPKCLHPRAARGQDIHLDFVADHHTFLRRALEAFSDFAIVAGFGLDACMDS